MLLCLVSLTPYQPQKGMLSFQVAAASLLLFVLPCTAALLPTYAKALSYDADPTYWASEEGVGHFSQWSKATKRQFVDDVRAGKAQDWVLVMGNEGGG